MYAHDMQAQSAVLNEFRDAGVSVERFPDDVMSALQAASETVLEEAAQADADFAEVIQSYKAFSESYDEYRELTAF